VEQLPIKLNSIRVGGSFRRNGEGTKSETLHFSGTNYTASIMIVSTDSVRGSTLFLSLIEFNLIGGCSTRKGQIYYLPLSFDGTN